MNFSTSQKLKILCAVLTAWLVLFALPVAAQKLAIRSYTVADGLAHNSVHPMFQDPKGFLWLATAEGLSRFDGYNFTNYGIESGLAHIYVNHITVDRQGRLWVATNGGGVSMLIDQPDKNINPSGRKKFVRFSIAEGGEENYANLVNRILFAAENRFWRLGSADKREVNYANLAAGNYRFLVRAVSAEGITSAQPAHFEFQIPRPIWQRWWFVASLLVLATAMIYGIYRYRLSRLLEMERVRTRIATDLHYDIGSGLSQVSVLSEVLRRRVGLEDGRDGFSDRRVSIKKRKTMNKKSILQNIFVGSIFVCLAAGAAFAQTTEFLYQGKLTDSGTPQSTYQMRLELYDALTGGNQIGATVTNPSVTVTQSVFTVQLDFGAAAFDGTD